MKINPNLAAALVAIFGFAACTMVVQPSCPEKQDMHKGVQDGIRYWDLQAKQAFKVGGSKLYNDRLKAVLLDGRRQDALFENRTLAYRNGFTAAVKCMAVDTSEVEVDNEMIIRTVAARCANVL